MRVRDCAQVMALGVPHQRQVSQILVGELLLATPDTPTHF